jgi:hypothetical protein
MPWDVGEVDQFKKGLTETQKRRWIEVANSALAACLKEGGEDCEASAIKQANAVIEEAAHEHESLADKILEAVFDEKASFKATIKGFLAAAKALINTPGIPQKYASQIAALNDTISSSNWAKLSAEESAGHQSAKDANKGSRGRSQSIAEAFGGMSLAEIEGALPAALKAKLGPGEWKILDVYETAVIFSAEGGMWGAPFTVSEGGKITLGKPVRVKRICRYVRDDAAQDEEKPRDQDDQGGELSQPGEDWKDWWKYSQDWGDGFKILGSKPMPTDSGDSQEALREDGAIVTEFVETGAIVKAGENDG